jgi:hypothetical protein
MTTARDYFERPGLLTLKQFRFMTNIALAGEAGFVFADKDTPMFVDLVKLGFTYFMADGAQAPVRAYLTSTGEYVRQLAANVVPQQWMTDIARSAEPAAEAPRFKPFQVLQGGRG